MPDIVLHNRLPVAVGVMLEPRVMGTMVILGVVREITQALALVRFDNFLRSPTKCSGSTKRFPLLRTSPFWFYHHVLPTSLHHPDRHHSRSRSSSSASLDTRGQS